jgi:hypothetical protein
VLVQATNANNSNFLVRVLVDLQQVLLPQIYWFECWFNATGANALKFLGQGGLRSNKC